MVDVTDSKSVGGNTVWVRVPPPALVRRTLLHSVSAVFVRAAKISYPLSPSSSPKSNPFHWASIWIIFYISATNPLRWASGRDIFAISEQNPFHRASIRIIFYLKAVKNCMEYEFSRTELLLGTAAMQQLAKARVAVFGLGGVGGYAVEALARSGIGALDLIDHDVVSISNLNRQILATHRTIGMYKTEAAKERILSIHPSCCVTTHNTFFLPETAAEFQFRDYDYVIDAIDTVTGKIQLILASQAAGTPIISAMGAGNKLDPSAFRVADIYSTKACPLARVMRQELKRRGVKKLKVVYSEEKPISAFAETENSNSEREGGKRAKAVPGSVAFVPSVAGLILAGEVIKDLISEQIVTKEARADLPC